MYTTTRETSAATLKLAHTMQQRRKQRQSMDLWHLWHTLNFKHRDYYTQTIRPSRSPQVLHGAYQRGSQGEDNVEGERGDFYQVKDDETGDKVFTGIRHSSGGWLATFSTLYWKEPEMLA